MRILILALLFAAAFPAYSQTAVDDCLTKALDFESRVDDYLNNSGAQFHSSVCERVSGGSFRYYLRTDCATEDPDDYNSVTFFLNANELWCYVSGSTYTPPCNTRIFEVSGIDYTDLGDNRNFAEAKRLIAELCRSYEPPAP